MRQGEWEVNFKNQGGWANFMLNFRNQLIWANFKNEDTWANFTNWASRANFKWVNSTLCVPSWRRSCKIGYMTTMLNWFEVWKESFWVKKMKIEVQRSLHVKQGQGELHILHSQSEIPIEASPKGSSSCCHQLMIKSFNVELIKWKKMKESKFKDKGNFINIKGGVNFKNSSLRAKNNFNNSFIKANSL